MREGPGSVYDKWNIFVVICDRYKINRQLLSLHLFISLRGKVFAHETIIPPLFIEVPDQIQESERPCKYASGIFIRFFYCILELVVFQNLWYFRTCGILELVVFQNQWYFRTCGILELVVFQNLWYFRTCGSFVLFFVLLQLDDTQPENKPTMNLTPFIF